MTREVSQFSEDMETQACCSNCTRAKTFYWDGVNLLTCDALQELIPVDAELYGKDVEECWQWNGKAVMSADALPKRVGVMDSDESEPRCHNCAHCLYDYKAEMWFCDICMVINPHSSFYTPIGCDEDCEDHEYRPDVIPEDFVKEPLV